MSYDLIIKLPPEGSLIRELTVSAIAAIYRNAEKLLQSEEYSLKYNGEYVILSLENMYSWNQILYTTLRSSVSTLKIKSTVLRAPKLHINDLNYVFKKLVAFMTRGSTYIDGFLKALTVHGPNVFNYDTVKTHYNVIEFKKGMLVYGVGKTYPLVQVFKVELYETATDFHRPSTVPFKTKLSLPWYILLGIGFAISYAGMFGNQVLFITPSEEVLETPPEVRDALALTLGATFSRRIANPIIPYQLYLALTLPEMVQSRILTKHIKENYSVGRELLEGLYSFLLGDHEYEEFEKKSVEGSVPKINIHRITIGRAYTSVERASIDLSYLAKFAYILEHYAEKEKSPKCREILRDKIVAQGIGGVDPKIMNVLTLLYETIHGAKDPRYVLYYLLRTISNRGIQIDKGCVSALIKALEDICGFKVYE